MLTAAAGNAAIRGNRFFAVHPYRPDRAKGGAYAAALAPFPVDFDSVHQYKPLQSFWAERTVPTPPCMIVLHIR